MQSSLSNIDETRPSWFDMALMVEQLSSDLSFVDRRHIKWWTLMWQLKAIG